RVLYHYHTVLSRKSKPLSEIAPAATLDIGPDDAKVLGINGDGAVVIVESRRGRVEARARVVDQLQKGLVFMSFHFREAAVNLLTLDVLDPISKIPGYKVCAVKIRKIAA
ncbi:MAG TPA: molybdopterin dinucleotide binding domain-containing protein, partial [Nitrospiraceae bacterium]|nr:molybdopterin dinucleotide binding domain-containing protein [Nitrospiraceae bacterium]